MNGHLAPDGDPHLTAHAAAAVMEQRGRGWRLIRPDKQTNIDAAIAQRRKELVRIGDAGERQHRAPAQGGERRTVRLEPGATDVLPDEVDLVVTSPGWKPTAPLLAQAAGRGIPVWGEVELAWRLRDPDAPAPWLAVTGTNGKTTTVQMLQSILTAAGLRAVAVGNVGLPIVEAVMDPEPYDVLAVELSSFQLHYTHSMSAESAAVLNVAEDHLDWYDDEPGGPTGMDLYAADKARIFERVQRACVYNQADTATEAESLDRGDDRDRTLVHRAECGEASAVGADQGVEALGGLHLLDVHAGVEALALGAEYDDAGVRVAAGGDQALDRPGRRLRVARPALQREAAVGVLARLEPRGGAAHDARAPLPRRASPPRKARSARPRRSPSGTPRAARRRRPRATTGTRSAPRPPHRTAPASRRG